MRTVCTCWKSISSEWRDTWFSSDSDKIKQRGLFRSLAWSWQHSRGTNSAESQFRAAVITLTSHPRSDMHQNTFRTLLPILMAEEIWAVFNCLQLIRWQWATLLFLKHCFHGAWHCERAFIPGLKIAWTYHYFLSSHLTSLWSSRAYFVCASSHSVALCPQSCFLFQLRFKLSVLSEAAKMWKKEVLLLPPLLVMKCKATSTRYECKYAVLFI